MKRFMMALCVCVPVALAGCCSSKAASMGWEFRVGKPATMASEAIVNQLPGASLIAPIAAYPAAPAGMPMAPLAPCGVGNTPAAMPRAPLEQCTLQQVCDTLERIERRLTIQAAPMPKRSQEE